MSNLVLRIIIGLAALLPLVSFFIKSEKKYIFVSLVPSLCTGAFLIIRAIQGNRPPGIGMVESLTVFCFALFVTSFITRKNEKSSLFTALFAVIFCLAVASVPGKMYKMPYMAPALESPLFFIHIPLFFIGYAILSFQTARAVTGKIPDLELASFFIISGIISGGIWAHIAWGFAWSWDPKETWALITLLVMYSSLHIKSPKAKKIITYISFGCMIFTFIGIAFLFKGLHSYQ